MYWFDEFCSRCVIPCLCQNETALEIAGRSRSSWVMHRLKMAAIGRGLDKTATLSERTVNNPVCFPFPTSDCWSTEGVCPSLGSLMCDFPRLGIPYGLWGWIASWFVWRFWRCIKLFVCFLFCFLSLLIYFLTYLLPYLLLPCGQVDANTTPLSLVPLELLWVWLRRLCNRW